MRFWLVVLAFVLAVPAQAQNRNRQPHGRPTQPSYARPAQDHPSYAHQRPQSQQSYAHPRDYGRQEHRDNRSYGYNRGYRPRVRIGVNLWGNDPYYYGVPNDGWPYYDRYRNAYMNSEIQYTVRNNVDMVNGLFDEVRASQDRLYAESAIREERARATRNTERAGDTPPDVTIGEAQSPRICNVTPYQVIVRANTQDMYRLDPDWAGDIPDGTNRQVVPVGDTGSCRLTVVRTGQDLAVICAGQNSNVSCGR